MNEYANEPVFAEITLEEFESYDVRRKTPLSHLQEDSQWFKTGNRQALGIIHQDKLNCDMGYTVFLRDKHGVYRPECIEDDPEALERLGAKGRIGMTMFLVAYPDVVMAAMHNPQLDD